jgi:hypothetical protein
MDREVEPVSKYCLGAWIDLTKELCGMTRTSQSSLESTYSCEQTDDSHGSIE